MKYVIVGAVAGGASTAARLRRMDEKAEIVMFEKGEYVSYANCGLPYYIGNVIEDEQKLFVQTATGFRSRFNIDVRVKEEVISIHPAQKKVKVRNLNNGVVYEESYDKLVLSPGAEPVRPPISGISLPGIFTLRNVPDTRQIKNYVQGRKSAVIVGAGFIGLEMAENLHRLGMEVTIIELGEQILAPVDYPIAALVQQHIRSKGVELRLKTAVTGFEKSGEGLKILLSDNSSLESEMVILAIGVRPDTRLAAEAGLKIGAARGIWVNEYLQTSDPDIYAVGDAIEFVNPLCGVSMNTYLAGPANKQGRICADNIVLGNKRKYKGAINTAIVKIFDFTVGATGIAAYQLNRMNMPHKVSTTRSASHAGYYPDAQPMTIQIIFSPDDGTLLGAQVAGIDGVDKRLDVLATFIQHKNTIYDLTEFEQAYAPPYSSAKDPVNMAGFVAENILNGFLQTIYWHEFETLCKKNNGFCLDVRMPHEFEAYTITGAVNIPLDELRNQLHEIPVDRPVYLFCEIGLRGYLAQRILLQNGFTEVYSLSGGFALWKVAVNEQQLLGRY